MKTVPKNNDNILKYLRNHHQQQIDKLLMKNQLEIDIVEEIRSFVKQKCNLDKNYAESLLKLSTNFQNKKLANIPNILRINRSETETIASPVNTRRISLTGDLNGKTC